MEGTLWVLSLSPLIGTDETRQAISQKLNKKLVSIYFFLEKLYFETTLAQTRCLKDWMRNTSNLILAAKFLPASQNLHFPKQKALQKWSFGQICLKLLGVVTHLYQFNQSVSISFVLWNLLFWKVKSQTQCL